MICICDLRQMIRDMIEKQKKVNPEVAKLMEEVFCDDEEDEGFVVPDVVSEDNGQDESDFITTIDGRQESK